MYYRLGRHHFCVTHFGSVGAIQPARRFWASYQQALDADLLGFGWGEGRSPASWVWVENF